MADSTYARFRESLLAGETSCVQCVQAFLDKIEAKAAINAVVHVYATEALTAAAAEDQRVQAGNARPLSGLCLIVKDNIAYANAPLSASSNILEGYQSPFTATCLQRLLDAGAIVVASANCDEFAMGSSNETSAYGPVHNPRKHGYVPGGSSGGSAAAVAAGLCHAALGTDTGGSIRQPAAFCGITGLKPTYGRVSRWGLIAFGSSFDQAGPMTPDVETAAAMLEVMAGQDPQDATSSPTPVPAYTQQMAEPAKPKRVGIIQQTLDSPGLQPEIRQAFEAQIARLQELGHEVVKVDFPFLDYLVPTYYVLATAEASSNLSRYDGIRYGHRTNQAQSLDELYTISRTKGFGKEVKRRIMLGTFVLSSGYYDAYYTKGLKVRRLIAEKTEELLQEVDFLASPTTPTTAFEIGGSRSRDPISMYLADTFTVHANLSGQPAISIPMGNDKSGLPMGFQLVAGFYEEGELLQMAASLQTTETS